MRHLPHDNHRSASGAWHRLLAAAVRRRGVAMLMVIISVMTATILTMSYLSSRDNSLTIGQNAIEASAARWRAIAGIDLAIATLQTDTDWRAAAATGVLLDGYPFMGCELTVHITDADTDQPPVADTVLVNLLAVVNCAGIEQRAEAFAAIATPTEAVFQLDLADFALFADEEIRVLESSLVTRWETSPRAKFGLPIPLGIRSSASQSVRIAVNSEVVDAKVHHVEGAQPNLVSASQPVRVVQTKDVIPLPNVSPPVDEPMTANPSFAVTSPQSVTTNQQWEDLSIQGSSGVLTLEGDLTVIIDNDLNLSGGGILVDGDVTMVVFNNVSIDDYSYIELKPDASLTFYVGRQVDIGRSYIGNERSDKSVFNLSGNSPWIDVSRLQMHSLEYGGDNDWVIGDQTEIKASIYAPHARVRVDGASAVYGRIAAQLIRVRNGSSVYYDHMLDHFAGYANPKSVLFDRDGYIYEAFKDIQVIHVGALSDVAEETGLRFRIFGRLIGDGGALADAIGTVGAGAPTPRPIAVDYQVRSVGMEPRVWELAAP
jgi:hypothetical protein